MSENEIRNNWHKAFKTKARIAPTIGWGFSTQDLIVLLFLHEMNLFRQEIFDLLEDCNFHTFCGLLDDQKYDEARQCILEDAAEDWEREGLA